MADKGLSYSELRHFLFMIIQRVARPLTVSMTENFATSRMDFPQLASLRSDPGTAVKECSGPCIES